MTENIQNQLNRTSDVLATVAQLIASGKLQRDKNKILGQLIVETVYDDEASMIVIECGMAGQSFPSHIHDKCIQYLICVRGRFSVNVPQDNIVRVIQAKECFTVGENVAHSVHCLEDNSKLIGIVIPVEPAYRIK